MHININKYIYDTSHISPFNPHEITILSPLCHSFSWPKHHQVPMAERVLASPHPLLVQGGAETT